jgi:hypothetical protein
MTYAELLKIGSMNEIAEKLIDIIGKRHTRREFANQMTRDALIEFFERGARSARREAPDQHTELDSSDDNNPTTQH